MFTSSINLVYAAPTMQLNKSAFDKGETIQITLTGGTADGGVMIQIDNPSGNPVWADQGIFDSNGDLQYQLKIPSSWSYGSGYLITIKDVIADVDTIKSFSIAPPSPPSPPPFFPPIPMFPTNIEPVAIARADQYAIVGHAVIFDGLASYDSDGIIERYMWNFGDGEFDFTDITSHIYVSAGIYNVTLTVVDIQGANDIDWQLVTVIEFPIEEEAELDETIEANMVDHMVDATTAANTTVTLDTTKPVTIFVLRYPENPYPEVPLPTNSLLPVIDIYVSDPNAVVWPIYVERYYSDSEVDSVHEARLALYYFKEEAWHKCRDTGVFLETNIVWANMYEDELTGSPIIMAELPAPVEFLISDLKVVPEEVAPNENVTISFTLTNNGSLAGDHTSTLKINGVTEETWTVSLDAGDSKTLSLTTMREAAGIYFFEVAGDSETFRVQAPAEFEYSIVQVSPGRAEPGESVDIDVEVINVGELAGAYEFDLLLDGELVEAYSGELAGGGSTFVFATVSSDIVGTHTVEVAGDSETFRVQAPAEYEYSIVQVSPGRAEPGESVDIDVEVINVGELAGAYEFDLLLDGELVEAYSGELAGGGSTFVFATVSSDIVGTHTVEVAGDSETFMVQAPEEPSPNRILWIVVRIIILAAIGILYILRRVGKT